jgi:hypothetical protein
MDKPDTFGYYISYGSPQIGIGVIIRTPETRFDIKDNPETLNIKISEDKVHEWKKDVTYYLPKEIFDKLYSN